MKKLYAFMASAVMGAFSVTASAQSYTVLQDLSSKVSNADFSADAAVDVRVFTYAKDMTDDGLAKGGTSMYGMQPITGWTASNPTDNTRVVKDVDGTDASLVGGDARAAAIFSYRSESDDTEPTAELGGAYYAPFDGDCSSMTGGKALGMVSVWGSKLQYTQDITLPAGSYMLIFPIANTSGTKPITKNLNGFITADGVEYLASRVTFTTGIQENDTVVFKLDAETKGVISIGVQGGNTGSADSPHLFYDRVGLYSIDPTELIKAEVNALKEELKAVIDEGGNLGADTKEANKVYLDENATLEQVKAAIESQKQINESSVTDLSEFFIKNPHFNLDTPIEGGICTYSKDMVEHEIAGFGMQPEVKNFGMQPLTGWIANDPSDNVYHTVNNEATGHDGRSSGVYSVGGKEFLGDARYLAPMSMSDGTTEGKVLGFLAVWNCLTQYTQNVTIPAGKYTLTISYYNAGGTGEVAQNLMGFVSNSGDEYFADTKKFKEGSWEKMKIFFELEEPTSGYFSLGMKAANAGSGSMPHFFIDGITLNYVGEANFDPSLLALQAATSSATEMLDKPMQGTIRDELEKLIDEGNDLVSTQSDDVEANKAATDAINNYLRTVVDNVAAYEKLQQFSDNELEAALEKYADMEALSTRLLELQDDVNQTALQDFEWSTEQINEAIASLDGIIKEEMQKAWEEAVKSGEELKEPLDITSLLEGLSYTFSTTALQGTNIAEADKVWNYGDASNFKTQYGTAEVWNQSPFTVTRTLSDMPAGTYTITTRAFYRTADNETSYSNWQDDKTPLAFVFAGHNKTPLANVAEIASADANEFKNSAPVAEASLYVPNNQETAYNIFNSDKYTEVIEKSVSTVLADKGDLKFGITSDQMSGNSWCVWYSFQISYNAIDADILDDELENLIAQATEMTEEVSNVQKAATDLQSACEKGNAASSSDDKIAAVIALNNAISYAEEAQKAADELVNIADAFNSLAEDAEFVSTDDAFLEMLGVAAGGEYEDLEQINNLKKNLPAAWVAYVLAQDLTGATEESPVDLSDAILNNDFSSGNINNWTITPEDEEAPIGQNQGFQNNSVYTNADTEVTINEFVEAWRPDGAVLNNGTIDQEIKAVLPAGFYVLEADIFALNQKEVPADGTNGVYLMAKNALGTFKTDVCVDEKEGPLALSHQVIAFESDGKSLTTVGLLVQDTNASWTAADNFALKYIGTTAPVAIEEVVDAAATSAPSAIYTVGGVKTNQLQRGVNIVKMANGKTVKVVK